MTFVYLRYIFVGQWKGKPRQCVDDEALEVSYIEGLNYI